MQENVLQIPQRLRELRDILDISKEDLAESVGVTAAEYDKFETGESDIPISTLYKLAAKMNVDMSVLLFGDEPRMDAYTIMRKGDGVPVERYEGYSFLNLAFNFKNRIMEPMIVSLQPGVEALPVAHGGQEFNFVLEGTVKVVIGNAEHILNEGDSIYFNPRIPHGQYAVGGNAKFLTVIQE